MNVTINSFFGHLRAMFDSSLTATQCLEIQRQSVEFIQQDGQSAAELLLPYIFNKFQNVPASKLWCSHTLSNDSLAFILCLHRSIIHGLVPTKEMLHYIHRLMTFLVSDYQFMHGQAKWTLPTTGSDLVAVYANLSALYDVFVDCLDDNHYGLLGYVTHLSALVQMAYQLHIKQPCFIYEQNVQWAEFSQVVEQFFLKRDRHQIDGLFQPEIEQILKDSNNPIPFCLLEYHKSYGRILLGCDHIIPLFLVATQMTSPLIAFMIENQGCVAWAIEAHTNDNDPLVYCLKEIPSPTDDLAHQFTAKDLMSNWKVVTHTHLTFSQFILDIIKNPFVSRTSSFPEDGIPF